LLYFTKPLLWSSTCIEHYTFIVRRLNCINAASGIATLSKWLSGAQVERKLSSLSTCAPEIHLAPKRKWWIFFIVLLTVHVNIILGNDQLDTQLVYFTIRLLWSSTCIEHYMLIIRRLNFIDAASGIVTLSKWPSGAQAEREIQPVHLTATYWGWRYQILHQRKSASWWWAYNCRKM
jgi:hypothetical protein